MSERASRSLRGGQIALGAGRVLRVVAVPDDEADAPPPPVLVVEDMAG
jgi:hypothetical protein